jgi:hypothetical protein
MPVDRPKRNSSKPVRLIDSYCKRLRLGGGPRSSSSNIECEWCKSHLEVWSTTLKFVYSHHNRVPLCRRCRDHAERCEVWGVWFGRRIAPV